MDKQNKQDPLVRFGVSVPASIRDEIDGQAKRWKANRSRTIIRVWLEWKEARSAMDLPGGEGV